MRLVGKFTEGAMHGISGGRKMCVGVSLSKP
jgi:hypothetical protein